LLEKIEMIIIDSSNIKKVGNWTSWAVFLLI